MHHPLYNQFSGQLGDASCRYSQIVHTTKSLPLQARSLMSSRFVSGRLRVQVSTFTPKTRLKQLTSAFSSSKRQWEKMSYFRRTSASHHTGFSPPICHRDDDLKLIP